jgi:hypothetical protein
VQREQRHAKVRAPKSLVFGYYVEANHFGHGHFLYGYTVSSGPNSFDSDNCAAV